jgi:hypothetical protein
VGRRTRVCSESQSELALVDGVPHLTLRAQGVTLENRLEVEAHRRPRLGVATWTGRSGL